jgi:hypothetical protein
MSSVERIRVHGCRFACLGITRRISRSKLVADHKSEYADGVVYATSGASPIHHLIVVNVGAELRGRASWESAPRLRERLEGGDDYQTIPWLQERGRVRIRWPIGKYPEQTLSSSSSTSAKLGVCGRSRRGRDASLAELQQKSDAR